MHPLKPFLSILAVVAVSLLPGCSTSHRQSADMIDGLRASLNEPGLKDVTVAQDRDKGVITLSGHVAANSDKDQAESIARSAAGTEVVANQITVLPAGEEHTAKKVSSDLDEGIRDNLDAALIQNHLHKNVGYHVTTQVVTLTGDVDSQHSRRQAADVASSVPNVQQVVNELQVKNQKASSLEPALP